MKPTVMFATISSSLAREISNDLAMATQKVGTALRRLSTGNEINGPTDGIAAYDLSVQLTGQIRGINNAILNVNSTSAMVTQADSALSQIQIYAYSLRQIAQQATDPTLSSSELTSLQQEAQTLLSQFNTLATSTQFDNQYLLNGSFGTRTIQEGPNSGDTFSFSIGDARTTTLGQIALYSGAQGAITSSIGPGTQLSLNGVTISTVSDGVSTSKATSSALALINAINSTTQTSGVTADTTGTVRTFQTQFSTAASYTGVISGSEFQINGVSITGTISSVTNLVTAINGQTTTTGVTASQDSNSNLVLTAVDGRNIELAISNGNTTNIYNVFNYSQNSTLFSNYGSLSQGGDNTYVGFVRLSSASAIQIGGTNASAAIGINSGTLAVIPSTAVQYMNISTTSNATVALKVLDATITQISTLRAQIGAVHDRLNESASYLVGQVTADQDSRSSIVGVDFATETANLVAAQILQNSGIASLAQANISQATVARLLQDI